jgi:hypothetical protein
LALRLGLAKLGQVALDGTTLRAHTAKHKAMSDGWMQRREAQLKEAIARLVAQAETQDATEDQEQGADSDGYSLGNELARREARLAKIQGLRERLEAEQRTEQGLTGEQRPAIEDTVQRSFAAGDARLMLRKRGDDGDAYNAQAAVDETSGVIVAAALTNVAADEAHLPPVGDQVRALRMAAGLAHARSTTMRADAGYFSHTNAAADGQGIDLLIAAGREDPAARLTQAGTGFSLAAFGDDPVADGWVCPAGTPLMRAVTPPGAMGRPASRREHAAAGRCASGPLRARCVPAACPLPCAR